MKTSAAILAGLLLSLVTFTIGVVGSALYLSTPGEAPAFATRDVTDLWTSEPIVVRVANGLERADSRQAPVSTDRSDNLQAAIEEGDLPDDDLGTTAEVSMLDRSEQMADTTTAMPIQHFDWCQARYNSYRAEDNTYKPFPGERRRCVSPYPVVEQGVSEGEDGIVAEVRSSAQRSLADVDNEPQNVTADMNDHIFRCGKRYRSYRAEDNSYQPFDGGARQQCR